MNPTPEQLINRRLLAQDAREQLHLNKFSPTEVTYYRRSGQTCQMCAVGAVVASGVAREYPDLPRAETSRGMRSLADKYRLEATDVEGSADFHVLLMHLTGLTLEEAVAFETAFMHMSVFVGRSVQEWSKLREPERSWSHQSPDDYDKWADESPLIQSAKKWYWAESSKGGDIVASRVQRLHKLLDLLESWETAPVSFPSEVS